MDAYIYQADLHCEKCIEEIEKELDKTTRLNQIIGDSDRYPQGPYPNGGGEADSPQHCRSCGLFLENPLTDDGELYIQEQVDGWAEDRQGNRETIQQWCDYYDYLDITLVNF